MIGEPANAGSMQARAPEAGECGQPASAGRNQDGTFAKGCSGNPAGKRKGTRNRATLLVEAMLEGELEAMMRMLVQKAKWGDIAALRLCLDRIVPARREPAIEIDLPEVRTVEDVAEASTALIAQVAAGEIDPAQANKVMRLLASHQAMIEKAQARETAQRSLHASRRETNDDLAIAGEMQVDPAEAHPRIETVQSGTALHEHPANPAAGTDPGVGTGLGDRRDLREGAGLQMQVDCTPGEPGPMSAFRFHEGPAGGSPPSALRAPGLAAAGPSARQALGHQDRADRPAVPHDDPELAAVTVRVPVGRTQLERPLAGPGPDPVISATLPSRLLLIGLPPMRPPAIGALRSRVADRRAGLPLEIGSIQASSPEASTGEALA